METAAVTREHPVAQLGERIEAIAGTETTSRMERKAIVKEALREVIKEWLDERFRAVGKWTVRGLASALFAALAYFILTHGGWPKP